jgi:hypothetical protein
LTCCVVFAILYLDMDRNNSLHEQFFGPLKKGQKVYGRYDGKPFTGVVHLVVLNNYVGGEFCDVFVTLDAPMTTSRGYTVKRVVITHKLTK